MVVILLLTCVKRAVIFTVIAQYMYTPMFSFLLFEKLRKE